MKNIVTLKLWSASSLEPPGCEILEALKKQIIVCMCRGRVFSDRSLVVTIILNGLIGKCCAERAGDARGQGDTHHRHLQKGVHQ